MNVLERINQLRTERDWSEYQLAEASEIPQSTISSWYRKGMLPSIGSLEKICKGFGVTMGYFFSDRDEAVSLTEEQRKLLDNWNRLTPKGKQTLIAFLEQL